MKPGYSYERRCLYENQKDLKESITDVQMQEFLLVWEGTKKCHSGLAGIFLCNTVFFYKEHYSEGFPTSGNDRIAEILTPMRSIEEFFDLRRPIR
jgi:hypothetical protein